MLADLNLLAPDIMNKLDVHDCSFATSP